MKRLVRAIVITLLIAAVYRGEGRRVDKNILTVATFNAEWLFMVWMTRPALPGRIIQPVCRQKLFDHLGQYLRNTFWPSKRRGN